MEKSNRKSWFELIVDDDENGTNEEKNEDINVHINTSKKIKEEPKEEEEEEEEKGRINQSIGILEIKNIKKEKEDFFSSACVKQEKGETVETTPNSHVEENDFKCEVKIKREKIDSEEEDTKPVIHIKKEKVKEETTDIKLENEIKEEKPGETSGMSFCDENSEMKFKRGARTRKRGREWNDKDSQNHIQSESSTGEDNPSKKKKSQKTERETDPTILARRQKQIDYGKNTIGYDRYIQQIPKSLRRKDHPKTPPKHIKYSRRAWDGLVRVWRQRLHFWDPPSERRVDASDSLSDISVELRSDSAERHPTVKRNKDSLTDSFDDELLDYIPLEAEDDF
ncbi:hypothetical protein L9F63_011521 [Diploptera punctata]|uniref:Histone RNA hairpin-binding protein RNA-binding domain-containing protein n=1 Tax=Diploptera punctata TaxID=6984 RepID=A0AAD8AF95_DIPPU|nr:hypothetical protein L9F63_011521 [Diploptera punctata]